MEDKTNEIVNNFQFKLDLLKPLLSIVLDNLGESEVLRNFCTYHDVVDREDFDEVQSKLRRTDTCLFYDGTITDYYDDLKRRVEITAKQNSEGEPYVRIELGFSLKNK